MKSVLIGSADIATALGVGLQINWERLMAGDSGVAEIARFDPGALGYKRAACMRGLEAGAEPNLTCALTAKCLENYERVPSEAPVIWAGCKGAAEYIEQRANGQDANGPYLAEQYRAWVANRMGLDGGGLSINAACASSTAAIALAAEWVATGLHERVLVCAADVVSRFTHSGFAALRALSAGVCSPFDKRRDGLVLGDGAIAILICSETAIGSMNPLARITGWGIANDATHITAPARDGSGLIAAMNKALARAKIEPDNVAAFCAHGTGTVFNDAMELVAADAIFGSRPIPIFSVKGAIGHALGAAGGIEALLCARALAERRVPPTCGLEEPEQNAQRRCAAQAQEIGGGAILTSNSGFGGVNVALVLEGAGR